MSTTQKPRSSARRLCIRLGKRSSQVTKPSKHLPFEHSDMEKVRLWVGQCSETHGINPRLIANMDQVCSTHYEHARRTLYKPQQDRGTCPSDQHKPTVKKMIASIEAALGLSPTGCQEIAPYAPRHPVLNAEGNLNPVDYHRVARTTTTVSWSDGTLATAYVTAPNSTMPMSVVTAMNEELKGV